MQLAGAGFVVPKYLTLPASFSKTKKAGRREYLRARQQGEIIEIFASEGSGMISGLSWAEGLVELPDEALEIIPGNPVKYFPFSSFGL
jgi:molybdopterin molybdotransferase